MKVIYHLGAHCTDEQKLVSCLRANGERLAAAGVIVPDPLVYRPILREAMKALGGAPASAEAQETLLDAVMLHDHAERLIFSNDMILSQRQRAVVRGKFYPNAAAKVNELVNLLPDHETEICFAIRNPATFVPALMQTPKMPDFETFMEGTDPHALRWGDMIERIRAEHPQVALTLWCDEDTPLIWPEVLAAVTGQPDGTSFTGNDEILSGLMTPEGAARLADYLRQKPPVSAHHRRRVTVAFLEKYALDDEIEMELDLPGWDDELVEALTAAYDAEVERIAAMENLRFILP